VSHLRTQPRTFVMHGKRETSWHLICVYNLGIEVNFGDFMPVTCILYVGLVKSFNLQLRCKFC